VSVNVVTDTASFLWRLKAYGHAVPAGLNDAAAVYSQRYFQKAGFAFADFHMALLAAATGNRAGVEQRVAELKTLIEKNALGAGLVVPAICDAALAFADEDYRKCAAILGLMAAEAARIGGSGAQREIIEDMLILSLIRSDQGARARTLLDRRLQRRPSKRDTSWQQSLIGP